MVGIESLEFGIEIAGERAFLRRKLNGVRKGVIPFDKQLLPPEACAVASSRGLKAAFEIVAQPAPTTARRCCGLFWNFTT
jgi:hypothetical protein